MVGDKTLMLLRLTYDHTVSPPGDLRTRPSSNDVTPVDKQFFFSSHILVNQPVLTKKTVLISDSREDQGRADIVGTHLRLSQQLRQAKESKKARSDNSEKVQIGCHENFLNDNPGE